MGDFKNKVTVSPIKGWKNAKEVKVSKKSIIASVPLKRVDVTTWINVRRKTFPKGVLVLNNKYPGPKDDKKSFKFPCIETGDPEIIGYKIDEKGAWPTGIVVLFKKKKKEELKKK